MSAYPSVSPTAFALEGCAAARLWRCALIAFGGALLGCSGTEDSGKEESAAPPVQSRARADPDLEGRWRVLSVDGQPPAGPAEGERSASFVFADYHFGGTIGCNQFGGLALLADGHFAAHGVAGTAIGCADQLGRQEQALAQLFLARPRVRSSGASRIRFESRDHVMEMERIGPADVPPLPAGPVELTGTSWRIMAIDGQDASAEPSRRGLRFDKGKWQGTAACATLFGTWRRRDDRILVGGQIASTEQNCPKDLARIDDSFAALMRSGPRYLVGPNGELLIAGGGHALAGERMQAPPS